MGPMGSEAMGREEAQWPCGPRIGDLRRGPWGQSSHIGGLRKAGGSLWVSGVTVSPTPTEKSVRCALMDQLNSGLGSPGAASKGHQSFPGWCHWLETQRGKSTCLNPRKPSAPSFFLPTPRLLQPVAPRRLDFIFLGQGTVVTRLTYVTSHATGQWWPCGFPRTSSTARHQAGTGQDTPNGQGEKCSWRGLFPTPYLSSQHV